MPWRRLRLFAGGLGALELTLLFLGLQDQRGLPVHEFCAASKHRHERGVCRERVQTGPRFGGRSAPANIDHSDWDVLMLLNIPGEEIAHCGKAADRSGAALAPWIPDDNIVLR